MLRSEFVLRNFSALGACSRSTSPSFSEHCPGETYRTTFLGEGEKLQDMPGRKGTIDRAIPNRGSDLFDFISLKKQSLFFCCTPPWRLPKCTLFQRCLLGEAYYLPLVGLNPLSCRPPQPYSVELSKGKRQISESAGSCCFL